MAAEGDMRGYAAIVGVFRQKCGFLPERLHARFKPKTTLRSLMRGFRVEPIEVGDNGAPALPPRACKYADNGPNG